VAELQPGVENGDRPPNVAEWTARAEVLYRTALPWSGSAGASFTGRLGYNYIGKRYTDAANDGALDPVDLISARLGLAWKNADAYVYGENLLGRRYKVVNQPWGVSANSGEPIFGASYARGAVVGVGASWRF
jgi:iron complex outermembrane recepter protein